MGVINKLRDKMGKVVVFAVGLSILAFVATDLLGPQSALLGGGQQNVGEVSGQKISYQDFMVEMEDLKTSFFVGNRRNPNAQELEQLRQQAWNNYILRISYGMEYEELGVLVTDAEMVDMVQGVNINQSVIQAFTDPNTGVFNKAQLIGYLQNLETMDAMAQRQWSDFERSLKLERRARKHINMLSKSVYATKYDLQRDYIKRNAKATGGYVFVPYFSIADSLVEVTDSDLKTVLNERSEEYKLTDNITIDYVSFNIQPSAEDTAYFIEEMTSISREFAEISDDSAYIKLNSDESTMPVFFQKETLPTALRDTVKAMAVGEVIGPVNDFGAIRSYKLISRDFAPDSIMARHILINMDNRDEEAAKTLAESILDQAKAGGDFAELAKQYSEGPSGPSGGDLGWFTRGAMVPPFNDACFSRREPGLIEDVVKTQFGFHVIFVEDLKMDSVYFIGQIARTIVASDDTRDIVFRNAGYFSGNSNDAESFQTAAEESGLSVITARSIGKNDDQINAISNVNQIIRWGFSEADLGDISEVFELDDQFMVCLLVDRQEKGDATVEEVRDRLKPIAIKKKKAKMIAEKLDQLPQEDLEATAKAYGTDAKYYTIAGQSLDQNSLTGVGFDPYAMGTVFGLMENSMSAIFEGENGVAIFSLSSLSPAPAKEDFSDLAPVFKSAYENSAESGISQAITEEADIIDDRYKFF